MILLIKEPVKKVISVAFLISLDRGELPILLKVAAPANTKEGMDGSLNPAYGDYVIVNTIPGCECTKHEAR